MQHVQVSPHSKTCKAIRRAHAPHEELKYGRKLMRKVINKIAQDRISPGHLIYKQQSNKLQNVIRRYTCNTKFIKNYKN